MIDLLKIYLLDLVILVLLLHSDGSLISQDRMLENNRELLPTKLKEYRFEVNSPEASISI